MPVPAEVEGGKGMFAEGAMGTAAAVAFTGLPRNNLYEMMGRGELPFVKIGRRRLIPRKALVELLAKGMRSES